MAFSYECDQKDRSQDRICASVMDPELIIAGNAKTGSDRTDVTECKLILPEQIYKIIHKTEA